MATEVPYVNDPSGWLPPSQRNYESVESSVNPNYDYHTPYEPTGVYEEPISLGEVSTNEGIAGGNRNQAFPLNQMGHSTVLRKNIEERKHNYLSFGLIAMMFVLLSCVFFLLLKVKTTNDQGTLQLRSLSEDFENMARQLHALKEEIKHLKVNAARLETAHVTAGRYVRGRIEAPETQLEHKDFA